MSLMYRTLLMTNNFLQLQVDFLTKNAGGTLIFDLTNNTADISNVIAPGAHSIIINTVTTNYNIIIYKDNVLYQTFSSQSGNTTNNITFAVGTYKYYIEGPSGMSFTTQVNISFTGGPRPQSVNGSGFNNTGQTI